MSFNKLKRWMACSLLVGMASAPAAHAAMPVKEWTVMIFLNGHNNLDSFGHEDMNEMEKVGSTSQFNVVVQWASLSNGDTQRLYVKKDQDESNVNSQVVQSMPPVDMGDYKKLAEFMKWTAENYPAKHYFVGVWNHGSGWRGVEPISRNGLRRASKGISYDDLSGNYITTPQLRLALDEFQKTVGKTVDVFGADACLMGMAEVAYELRNHARYFVASQELEAGDGWPYDTWLNLFRSMKDNHPRIMAESLVKAYNYSYRPDSSDTLPDADATLSVMDLTQMEGLAQQLNMFHKTVVAEPQSNHSAVAESVYGASFFTELDYRDLTDVVKRTAVAVPTPAVKVAAARVMKQIREVVILSRRQETHQDTRGLSIWLPDSFQYSQFRADYLNLQFNKASGWTNYIEYMIQ